MKTSIGKCAIILIALLGIFSPARAQLTLGIAPAGQQSVLYWANTPTNYILQSTTNLTSTNWVWANDAVMVNAVTVSNTSPVRFFRLFQNITTADGMALIPAGAFTIGNTITNDSDLTDANPTNVYVSAFYMDTNLVSYSQWQTVYAYATNHGYAFVNAGTGKAANQPVQTVDWYDAVKWCNARSQQAGLTPVYYQDVNFTQIYTNGQSNTALSVNWTNNGYRLPTEAEWEKAARSGLSGQRFPWGNTISESQANYFGDTNDISYDLGPNGYNAPGSIGGTSPATSPVGSFAPNGYGLYDMAGNVFEWCWDRYSMLPYPAGSAYLGGSDPHGAISSSFSNRVLRGGYWGDEASGSRCAYRFPNGLPPTTAFNIAGFRCVRKY